MNEKGYIVNIIAIAVVLTVVFFSQQQYLKPNESALFLQAKNQTSNYITAKLQNSFLAKLYKNLSAQALKRGASVTEVIENQKNVAAQSIWGKIKNYLAGKFSKTFGVKVE